MTENRILVGMTCAENGRFATTERLVDRDGLLILLGRLSAIDQAYVEVRLVGPDFPVLMVGSRKGLAVVQCMVSAESLILLLGDESMPVSEFVDVLIMDDLVAFTGEYVMKSTKARNILLQFVDGAAVSSLGDWHKL